MIIQQSHHFWDVSVVDIFTGAGALEFNIPSIRPCRAHWDDSRYNATCNIVASE
jgi:hypothetical protein